jgi:hypothetical protein
MNGITITYHLGVQTFLIIPARSYKCNNLRSDSDPPMKCADYYVLESNHPHFQILLGCPGWIDIIINTTTSCRAYKLNDSKEIWIANFSPKES